MRQAAEDANRPDADWQRDPRHVFLIAREVIARYGWGKTKGYQNLKNRDLIPPPVMTHPDRWRLDHLLIWEDRHIAPMVAAAVEAANSTVASLALEARFPAPKRTHPRSA